MTFPALGRVVFTEKWIFEGVLNFCTKPIATIVKFP
jgi:hypothetical protein